MPVNLERLLLRLEVSQRKFEKQLASANQTAKKQSRAIERNFLRTNKNISASFGKMSAVGSRAFATVSRLALIAAGSLGIRQLIRYADAWTLVENKIKAAEQISGTQARTTSKLVDLANQARAPLESTADLYARLLRVSGDIGATEEQVAQATLTTAKAFKAGGAGASEQAAGILQLSQALSSGFLQGDELRSLRENAPLVAQAIATEFETTIGGLKKLGSEGELTADRVFKALLKSQDTIQAAFAVTVPTIAEGSSIMRNGLLELVAGFNEGSGASESMSRNMATFGNWLADNADAAERFGLRVKEALEVAGEAVTAVKDRLSEIGEGIGREFEISAEDVKGFVVYVIDAIQTVLATAGAVGAAIAQAMLNGVDAVAQGSVSIVNASISAIESILNKVISGVQSMIDSVNSLIEGANNLTGLNLPTVAPINPFNLERVAPPPLKGGGRTVGEAFSDKKSEIKKTLDDFEASVIGAFRRVKRAGDTPGDAKDPRGNQIAPINKPAANGATKPTDSAPDSGGGGSKAKPLDPLFADIAKQRADLEQQIALVGKTKSEIAALTAEITLLTEAKKRGLDLDKIQADTGRTLREEITAQSEAIGNLTEKYERAEEKANFLKTTQDNLKDSFLDAIIAGEGFKGILADLAKSLAKAALQAALFNEGPFSSGNGIGLLSSLFGGKRALGGTGRAGVPYLVNEATPKSEIFVPSQSGGVLNVPQAQKALAAHASRSGGGGGQLELSVSISGARGNAEIQEMVEAGVYRGLRLHSREVLPVLVKKISKDSRRVG